ncbi:DUF4389 domain-containing protein [Streptomyces sp. A0592]|uniref:DUF4389 domain-containing protein n=1 Tax=Streptomyces sp. A0592 TaxID=2563099 RepID=UPI00109E5EB2|nr:DUF4389 domain-containing protein [Streptomyces sp. A0592]THA83381.1 DUF4389 domain-containing protein [Streptomyces sp. A0592]
MLSTSAYPLRVEATLDPRLTRWMWLVKWVFAIPHYICLFFLQIAFLLVSLVAFFCILITGRYPRPLFDFNVGVIRWNTRVYYYCSMVLGTDEYPPFTLKDVPEYRVRVDVAYPERLSRWLVLVKWLLVIPQLLVIGVLATSSWTTYRYIDDYNPFTGLIGLLSLVAVVILACTGRYPRGLFDFLMGLFRWTLRVLAYASLMTDKYPPFRLDSGGPDPRPA